MLSGLQAIVLDLDDTLYLEADFVKSGFMAASRWILREKGAPGFFDVAWRLFESGERRNVFDLALPMVNIDPTHELIQALVMEYRQHEPRIDLLADARSLLDRTRGRLRRGLITDGDAGTQGRKIASLDIEGEFDHIVLTDLMGRPYWKPHPRAFVEAEQRLVATGPEIAYVADNPAKDFVAPNALDWITVMVARPARIHPHMKVPAEGDPRFTVSTLDELLFDWE